MIIVSNVYQAYRYAKPSIDCVIRRDKNSEEVFKTEKPTVVPDNTTFATTLRKFKGQRVFSRGSLKLGHQTRGLQLPQTLLFKSINLIKLTNLILYAYLIVCVD